jgi:long-subunit acyl-CoA synthetase (AMP-forming)
VVFGKKMVTPVILKDLKQGKITMLLGVPLLFNKLLAGILKGIRAKGPLVYGIISVLMGISGFIKKVFGVNPGKKLFHAVLEQASLTTLRVCICGGGPLAPSVFRKYNQLGIDFVQGYGLGNQPHHRPESGGTLQGNQRGEGGSPGGHEDPGPGRAGRGRGDSQGPGGDEGLL